MNIKNPIKSVIRSAANWAGVNVLHTTNAEYLTGIMGNLNASKATPNNALTYSAVYACVTAIAETVSALPFRVYEQKDSHSAPSPTHPLNYLISTSPSEDEGKIDFLITLIASQLLWGNGYAIIHKSNLMRVESYEWVHSSLVKPFKHKGKLYYAVKNTQTGKVDILTPDKIIHIKDLSTNGIEGVSRITANATSIEVGMAASQFGKNFFENGTNMSGVLETDGTLEDVNVEQLRTQFDNKYAGLSKAHKPLILEQGMKYSRIGIPPNDAQFLETRNFSKEEMAMIFRIPPSKLGIPTNSSYNSLEQENNSWVQNLTPLVKKIEEEFTRKSFRINERGLFRVKFDFKSLLRGDIKTRVEAQWKWFQMGALTPNGILALEGMQPRTDKGGDDYYVPLNLDNTTTPKEDGQAK